MKPGAFLKPFLNSRILLGTVFFAAIAVRLFLFFGVEKSLWLDEAALALNITDRSIGGLFSPLIYSQAAPPLFLIFTKFLTILFGAGEKVLRFIPFLCSVASVFAFYFLLREVFKNNNFICSVSVLIFSLSAPLLYNSIEFKPYTADVLFTILTTLIWFKYLNSGSENCIDNSAQNEVSLKKQIIFGVLLSVFPLFSFGSIFPLCAVLALSLFRKMKTFSLILFFGLLVEYLFIFSKISAGTSVYEYWVPYFINYNPDKILFIFSQIIKYLFYPSTFTLLCLIAFCCGCFCLFKRDKEVFLFFGLTISGAFLASFSNFYPLYERLSLFLYSMILIIIVYPLYCVLNEKDGIKKALIYLLSFIIMLDPILYNFLDKKIYKREEIKPLLSYLKGNIKPKDKIFVYKNAHVTFLYYNKIFDFKNDTYICAFNMKDDDCINKMRRFCDSVPAGNSCYIVYSSEINAGQNIKTLNNIILNSGGKIIKTDVNSVLYEMAK